MDELFEVVPVAYDDGEFMDLENTNLPPTHYLVRVPLESSTVEMFITSVEADLLENALKNRTKI